MACVFVSKIVEITIPALPDFHLLLPSGLVPAFNPPPIQQAQMDEKSTTSSTSASDIPPNSRTSPLRSTYRPVHPFIPPRPTPAQACQRSHRYVRPRGLRIWNLFKKWSPVLAYGATSLGFLLAIAFWKTQLFDGE